MSSGLFHGFGTAVTHLPHGVCVINKRKSAGQFKVIWFLLNLAQPGLSHGSSVVHSKGVILKDDKFLLRERIMVQPSNLLSHEGRFIDPVGASGQLGSSLLLTGSRF